MLPFFLDYPFRLPHRYSLTFIESYIVFTVSSLTEADRAVVHHVATGVCEEPFSTDSTW